MGTDSDSSSVAAGLSSEQLLAEGVLRVLFRRRRLLSEEPAGETPAPSPEEAAPHLDRLMAAIGAARPIHLILPAFPAKSPNPMKTLGPEPDLGERIGLKQLQDVCDEIGEFYAPGARCTICSDGHVFSDLVGVADDAVSRYRTGLLAMLDEERTSDLATFDLSDCFPSDDFTTQREELLIGYAEPQAALRERVAAEPDARTQFNGIHRFVFEDTLAGGAAGRSRNEIRNITKAVAYRVVQRSNAWSRLLEERFPEAIRLSIHPQRRVSPKIGVRLVPTDDPWGTPWHGVMLADPAGFRLVRRQQAEALDAALVYRGGRPSHFALPEAPRCPM